MILIKGFRYVFLYIWDKVVLILFLFQKEKNNKINQFYKLGNEGPPDKIILSEKVKNIWASLFDSQLPINESSIEKIYNLNFTIFFDLSFRKVDYLIKNHLWSLLDLYEIDTWGWSDQNVFDPPKLITYAIFRKDGGILIILVTLKNKKYTLLRRYDVQSFPLWKFKAKKLAFDQKHGFFSI